MFATNMYNYLRCYITVRLGLHFRFNAPLKWGVFDGHVVQTVMQHTRAISHKHWSAGGYSPVGGLALLCEVVGS